jgi:hypothetical protein
MLLEPAAIRLQMPLLCSSSSRYNQRNNVIAHTTVHPKLI